MTLNCKIALVLWKIILFVMAGFFCSIFDNIFLLGKLYQQFRQNPKQKVFSFNVDFFHPNCNQTSERIEKYFCKKRNNITLYLGTYFRNLYFR